MEVTKEVIEMLESGAEVKWPCNELPQNAISQRDYIGLTCDGKFKGCSKVIDTFKISGNYTITLKNFFSAALYPRVSGQDMHNMHFGDTIDIKIGYKMRSAQPGLTIFVYSLGGEFLSTCFCLANILEVTSDVIRVEPMGPVVTVTEGTTSPNKEDAEARRIIESIKEDIDNGEFTPTDDESEEDDEEFEGPAVPVADAGGYYGDEINLWVNKRIGSKRFSFRTCDVGTGELRRVVLSGHDPEVFDTPFVKDFSDSDSEWIYKGFELKTCYLVDDIILIGDPEEFDMIYTKKTRIFDLDGGHPDEGSYLLFINKVSGEEILHLVENIELTTEGWLVTFDKDVALYHEYDKETCSKW